MNIKKTFVIIFLGILFLPLFQMVTGFPNITALDENRILAKRPIFKTWNDLNHYLDDSLKWFNDNYGYRNFLIRLKTQLDYSFFGISSRVYIGKNGWFFYHDVIDTNQPSVDIYLTLNADKVVEGARQLAKELNHRGIKLIIMIPPMKNVFYSKFLPEGVKSLPYPRQLDMLQQKLKATKEITFIDSTLILEKLSSERIIFHKTDFHWNDPAAFDVARFTVNKIGELEGRNSKIWNHNLEIEIKPSSGGEARFMPLFIPPSEDALFVKKNWKEPDFIYLQNKFPFEWTYEIKNPKGTELPPLVVYGDSFFDGMQRSGICTYFNKVYRARTNDISLRDLVANIPGGTRYFLIEFIETDQRIYNYLSSEYKNK